ncbi:MAG TPA: GNAT family protein [Solirubrobacteraceae bacterium]|nr:GNAT family protein [Solirubrobacteraceae bacterium]
MHTDDRGRVEVRRLGGRDRDAFLAAMRASRQLHRPWLTAPTSDDQFDALLGRAGQLSFEPLLAHRRIDGAIVGFFNVNNIIRGNFQSATLGYGAVAKHAGNGYMTEALELVLRRAFTAMRLHRLEANIQPDNARSIALVRRCGFVHEGFSERYLKVAGRWRDHERWAIRSEQWRAG